MLPARMRRPIVISMYVDLLKGTLNGRQSQIRHLEDIMLSTHHVGIKHTHPGIVEGRNGKEKAHPPRFEQHLA